MHISAVCYTDSYSEWQRLAASGITCTQDNAKEETKLIKRSERYEDAHFGIPEFIMKLAVFVSCVFVALGTLMSVTIVLAPVGIPLMWIGAAIYAPVYLITRRAKRNKSKEES